LSASAIEIVRATEADISFIMATERLPGNDGLVGRWEREEHERALVDPHNAYFLGLLDGRPIGFVIVQHWATTGGATLIRRIIVGDPAKKIGRALLSKVIDTIFAETDASPVRLNVFPHNERAQRAYAAIGFRFEGRATSSGSGSGASLQMMLQRADWRQEVGEPVDRAPDSSHRSN
jgi:RimJ/RimL family protein N-acetyltransferase